MAFTFKCKATGDLTMLDATARQLLQIMGREAGPQGVITPEQMPSAMAALQAAVAEDEARAEAPAATDDAADPHDERPRPVPLKHRAQPMIRMLDQARNAGDPVHWGL